MSRGILTTVFIVAALITFFIVLKKSVLGVYVLFPPLLWFTVSAIAIVAASLIVASHFGLHAYKVVVTSWMLFFVSVCIYLYLHEPIKSRLAKQRYEKEKEEFSKGEGIFAPGLETEMAIAIMKNDTMAIKSLIQRGINLNARDRRRSFGYLQFAFEINSRYPDYHYKVAPETVKIMLDNGIDPNPPYPGESNNSGEGSSTTRLNLINCWREHNGDDPRIREMLLKAGTKVPQNWYTDDSKYFPLYLSHGAEINKVTWSSTPVMHLAHAERWRDASELIELGADITFVNEIQVSLKTILEGQFLQYGNKKPIDLINLSETVEAKILKK